MLRLQNARRSIKRLLRMIFGARPEHKRNVLPGVDVPDLTDAADGASPAANTSEPAGPLMTPEFKPKPDPNQFWSRPQRRAGLQWRTRRRVRTHRDGFG